MATRTVQATIVREDYDEGTAFYELEIKLPDVIDGELDLTDDEVEVVEAYVWGQQIFIELKVHGTPPDKWGKTMAEYLG